MCRLWTMTLLLTFALTASARAAGPEIVLVENGKSAYTIVKPAGPDPRRRVDIAARLLRDILRQATGAQLRIVDESRFSGGPAIYVGMTRAAKRAGLPLDHVKGWQYLHRAKGRDLYLVGFDGKGGPKLPKHKAYLGTTRSVTKFLEDRLGVRFLLPGPNGRYVPKLKRLAVPADLDVRGAAPVFTYVVGRRTADVAYNVANNFLFSPVLRSYGGHSYYTAVPSKKYAKTHPEYFALIGGVRSPAKNHLCISNPDVQKLMIEEIERSMDEGYEWIELAQTDGYVPCDCPKCRALHPEPSERLWIVHRKLAAEMAKRRPGKKVMIIAYGPTVHPPKTFDSFPKNVVIQMCHYAPEDFDEWTRFDVPKTVYVYNWGTYHVTGFGPKRTPRYADEQVKRFVASKVRGVYMCGAFECLGLEGPVYYVYGRTLGDPTLNRETVTAEYYRLVFGKARAPMKAFYEDMYESLELYGVLRRPNFRTERYRVQTLGTPEDAYCTLFPAKLLGAMTKNLERAKALAEDPAVRERLRLVEYEFEYVRNLATIFQLYRAYRLKPNWQTFGILAEAVEARRAMLKQRFAGGRRGRAKVFGGWGRLFGGCDAKETALGGRLRAVLSAPVNWNTALLKKKGILPGVGMKRMAVGRVSGIKLDGRLDEAAWRKAKPEQLSESGLGELRNGTRFRAGYDDRCFYFAFECDLAGIEHLQVEPHGQDGKCYQTECLEVFLDPFGKREKYYHFIFNPWPNSRYDARFGFIEDPIDPMYNRSDKSWNGAWDYVAHRDLDKKRWCAEVRIPFATLGVKPPSPGDSWTMNLGREEFQLPRPKHGGTVTLSLWSPNLESRSFHERSCFGEVTFK